MSHGEMKVCSRCHVEQPLESFYKDARRRDGHNYWCKECMKLDQARYRKTDARRRVLHKYNTSPKAREMRRRRDLSPAGLARHKAWRGTETGRNYGRRMRQTPEHRARVATNNAIKRGDLVRGPCEVCGAEPSQAHHEDYSKPLDVRWLCREHHRQLHAEKSNAA